MKIVRCIQIYAGVRIIGAMGACENNALPLGDMLKAFALYLCLIVVVGLLGRKLKDINREFKVVVVHRDRIAEINSKQLNK